MRPVLLLLLGLSALLAAQTWPGSPVLDDFSQGNRFIDGNPANQYVWGNNNVSLAENYPFGQMFFLSNPYRLYLDNNPATSGITYTGVSNITSVYTTSSGGQFDGYPIVVSGGSPPNNLYPGDWSYVQSSTAFHSNDGYYSASVCGNGGCTVAQQGVTGPTGNQPAGVFTFNVPNHGWSTGHQIVVLPNVNQGSCYTELLGTNYRTVNPLPNLLTQIGYWTITVVDANNFTLNGSSTGGCNLVPPIIWDAQQWVITAGLGPGCCSYSSFNWSSFTTGTTTPWGLGYDKFFLNSGVAPNTWPLGWLPGQLVSGSWSTSINRMRWYYSGCNNFLPLGFSGSYTSTAPPLVALAAGNYVQAVSPGADRSNAHYYNTDGGNIYINQPFVFEASPHPHTNRNMGPGVLLTDPEWWMPTTNSLVSGTNVHYFTGMYAVYNDTNPNATIIANLNNLRCTLSKVTFDTVTGGADSWVSNIHWTYTGASGSGCGTGQFASACNSYEVAWWAPDNSQGNFNVVYSTSEIKSLGFSNATSAGTIGGYRPGNADNHVTWVGTMAQVPNLYVGIRPIIEIQSMSPGGASPAMLTPYSGHDLTTGDQVAVAGLSSVGISNGNYTITNIDPLSHVSNWSLNDSPITTCTYAGASPNTYATCTVSGTTGVKVGMLAFVWSSDATRGYFVDYTQSRVIPVTAVTSNTFTAGPLTDGEPPGNYLPYTTSLGTGAPIVTGSNNGPYAITALNDQMLITIDGGSPVTVTLTTGASRTAAQVVTDINGTSGIPSGFASVSGSAVMLTGPLANATATLTLSTVSNSAYSTLGMSTGTTNGFGVIKAFVTWPALTLTGTTQTGTYSSGGTITATSNTTNFAEVLIQAPTSASSGAFTLGPVRAVGPVKMQ